MLITASTYMFLFFFFFRRLLIHRIAEQLRQEHAATPLLKEDRVAVARAAECH